MFRSAAGPSCLPLPARACIMFALTSPATEFGPCVATFPFTAACTAPSGERLLLLWRCRVAKEELLTMEGRIDEILPDGRFAVMLDNEVRIIAYTAGKMRKFRIRSIVGDRVHVEMTPYDLSKGRIVYREKVERTGAAPRRRGGFRR